MRSFISRKGIYKPTFFGYYFATGFVKIIDGILTIIVSPFGFDSDIYSNYCEWNIRRGMDRRKNRKVGNYCL